MVAPFAVLSSTEISKLSSNMGRYGPENLLLRTILTQYSSAYKTSASSKITSVVEFFSRKILPM